MSQSTGVSQPSYIKRLEALLEKALTSSAAGLRAFVAASNKGHVSSGALDALAGPSANVIIAAANVQRKASGLFVVQGAWTGDDAGADTISLDIASIGGPTTAFSGGTLSADGTLRFADAGAVTATGTGATLTRAASQVVTAGALTGRFLNVSGLVDLNTEPLGQLNLLLLQINATQNLANQLVSFSFFELP